VKSSCAGFFPEPWRFYKEKNLRLLQITKDPLLAQPWDIRSVGRILSCCSSGICWDSGCELKIVTKRQPTDPIEAMLFGWRVVKHLKSNAILYSAKGARWERERAR